ncbi:cell envelope integrity protein TolA [Moraxella nasibovis]|uniref:cell envelope integrity protein TolA n=1 Tax=Moraxella nasibovis TaxID=2904120 RepID=UPI00240FA994|nr:cell envelope integrity protein TolA [Moraxella nasibovis]WFF37784.1 cell envelope integrity protein TolA [Moraxella nasibovis]
MSDVNFTSNNHIKALAVGVAVALHGLAGFGVANMQMPELKPLKITPPITVEIIEPIKEIEIEQVVDEVIQTPQPIKPIIAPKTEVNPDPRPAAAKPKVEPAKEPPQKIKQTTPKIPEPNQTKQQQKTPATAETTPQKNQQEANQQAEILAKQQAEAQARWEAEQRAEAEKKKQEKAAAEARLKAEADAKAKAAAQAEADARAKAKAEAAAKARAEAEAAALAKAEAEAAAAGKAKNTSNNTKDQGGGRGTGNKIGDITISAAKANASWRNKPNFSKVDVEDAKVQTISFTVHLEINEKGRITSATGVNTGLGKNVDSQITKAIRAASFNPFKDEQGNPVRGKVTLPMNFTIN